MDPKEYDALLASIEQMIEISLRGDRRGNHFQILGGLENTTQEHVRLYSGSVTTSAMNSSMRMPVGIAKVAVE